MHVNFPPRVAFGTTFLPIGLPQHVTWMAMTQPRLPYAVSDHLSSQRFDASAKLAIAANLKSSPVRRHAPCGVALVCKKQQNLCGFERQLRGHHQLGVAEAAMLIVLPHNDHVGGVVDIMLAQDLVDPPAAAADAIDIDLHSVTRRARSRHPSRPRCDGVTPDLRCISRRVVTSLIAVKATSRLYTYSRLQRR